MIMSANTIIVLEKVKDGFKVTFKDVESSDNSNNKLFKDLKSALKYAKEIQDNEEVEYGIYIKSL